MGVVWGFGFGVRVGLVAWQESLGGEWGLNQMLIE